MEKAGVPISIISKWAGHYDSSFTMKTYVHEDLKQGRQALAKIHHRPTHKALTSRLLVRAGASLSQRARSEGLEPPTF